MSCHCNGTGVAYTRESMDNDDGSGQFLVECECECISGPYEPPAGPPHAFDGVAADSRCNRCGATRMSADSGECL